MTTALVSTCVVVLAALVLLLVRVSRQARRRLDRMARQAYVDELTELPNRTRFRQEVERAIRAPAGHDTAVVLLDLDRFKQINDTLGHACGDKVLRAVAGRLATLEGAEFALARLGGDEFGILARADAVSAVELGRRALDALKPPFEIDGIPLAVETSIGV